MTNSGKLISFSKIKKEIRKSENLGRIRPTVPTHPDSIAGVAAVDPKASSLSLIWRQSLDRI